jgi:hypothetical protein
MERNIFDDEHEMFRDAARSFYKHEVLPQGERWREQGIVDRDAYLKAGEQGMLLKNTAVLACTIFATNKYSLRRLQSTANQVFL